MGSILSYVASLNFFKNNNNFTCIDENDNSDNASWTSLDLDQYIDDIDMDQSSFATEIILENEEKIFFCL
jgi:hypothetical protein